MINVYAVSITCIFTFNLNNKLVVFMIILWENDQFLVYLHQKWLNKNLTDVETDESVLYCREDKGKQGFKQISWVYSVYY